MKLYSRSQVVVIVCVTVIAMFLLCASMAVAVFRVRTAEKTEELPVDSEEIQEESKYSDTPVFEFKTSAPDQVKKLTLTVIRRMKSRTLQSMPIAKTL